jgi:hypothetical protein
MRRFSVIFPAFVDGHFTLGSVWSIAFKADHGLAASPCFCFTVLTKLFPLKLLYFSIRFMLLYVTTIPYVAVSTWDVPQALALAIFSSLKVRSPGPSGRFSSLVNILPLSFHTLAYFCDNPHILYRNKTFESFTIRFCIPCSVFLHFYVIE